jgi:hypothetical protein
MDELVLWTERSGMSRGFMLPTHESGMETEMRVEKKNFKVTVSFGDERQRKVYAFHTQAELDAFLRGVDDAVGWSDYDVDENTFSKYTRIANPHRLNEVRGGIIYDE